MTIGTTDFLCDIPYCKEARFIKSIDLYILLRYNSHGYQRSRFRSIHFPSLCAFACVHCPHGIYDVCTGALHLSLRALSTGRDLSVPNGPLPIAGSSVAQRGGYVRAVRLIPSVMDLIPPCLSMILPHLLILLYLFLSTEVIFLNSCCLLLL